MDRVEDELQDTDGLRIIQKMKGPKIILAKVLRLS
jgi:hypothetical protein